MKKIVIFDMDGTLIDSKKDITISVNYIREKHHNLAPLSEEYIVEAINMYERNLPKLFYNTEIYENRDRKLFEEHYKEQCIQNPYLYDGIKELLKSLKEQDVKMSVATNAPTLFAKTMLTHLDVATYFDLIVGADRVKLSKPNPEMIHFILDSYKYTKDKDKAWMIGDNSKDIQSAKSAGINDIFATWGFSSTGDYDIVVKKPNEVLDIVL